MLLFLTNSSLGHSEEFLYTRSWALIAMVRFSRAAGDPPPPPHWPAFTLGAQNTVGIK